MAMAATGGGGSGGGGDDGGDDEPPKDPATELAEINDKLKNKDALSGKEKARLRARKKELQEQLRQTSAEEPVTEETPTPQEFRQRESGLSGKEAATDVPSWIQDYPDGKPGVNESGKQFASRMMDKKYGVGNWERKGQQGTEFSQLKKFGDRAFKRTND